MQVFVACVIRFLFGKDVLFKWRGADVELCVNNLDLISTGRSPSDYRPSTISRADIYDLQCRKLNEAVEPLNPPNDTIRELEPDTVLISYRFEADIT